MEDRPAPTVRASSGEGGDFEWDCPICFQLLYEPTTADCGHSFCRRCAHNLVSSTSTAGGTYSPLTRHPKCPICRQSLPRWSLFPSIALEQLLRHSFPIEYSKREAEEQAITTNAMPGRRNRTGLGTVGGFKQLPVFVLDPMLPGQRMFLHVFEIRYRLLIQRALADHDCRFGMAGGSFLDASNEATFLTECEITNYREFADGRFHVEIIGRLVFKMVEKNVRDGYWEATVECPQTTTSTAPPATTTTATTTSEDDTSDQQQEQPERGDGVNEIEGLVRHVKAKYSEWEDNVRINSWERHSTHMDDIKRHLGSQPHDPENLARWVAAAINPLPPLGVASEIRPAILASVDNRERLIIVRDALDESLKLVARKRGTIKVCGFTVHIQTLFLLLFSVVVLPLASLSFQAQIVKVMTATGLETLLMRYVGDSSCEAEKNEDL